ncbi:MAG: carboxylating nicotinate-nucleotide diphosphorylase [Phycisphaerae bacterium]|nr:carboxylating nicotinate-nucleotide diphosphorylase [Phycisphaerae bacterium]
MIPPADLNSLDLPVLFRELCAGGLVRRLLEIARDEDLGVGAFSGDITSRSWSPGCDRTSARLVAREGGVVSGLAAMPMLLELFAPGTRVEASVHDGAAIRRGEVLASLDGPTVEVLALERTMLNLVGRLSGVATMARRFVDAIGPGVRARLFDTRKTTPGLRVLEKYAVRCGGGLCHRLGLYDAMLVKDNHVSLVPTDRLAERAAEAARRGRAERPLRFVEIEADRLEQVEAILSVEPGLIDVILLDNMGLESLREAVALRDRKHPGMLLEASGGIRVENVRAVAESGVDRISVGALTHSAVSLDVGLDAK